MPVNMFIKIVKRARVNCRYSKISLVKHRNFRASDAIILLIYDTLKHCPKDRYLLSHNWTTGIGKEKNFAGYNIRDRHFLETMETDQNDTSAMSPKVPWPFLTKHRNGLKYKLATNTQNIFKTICKISKSYLRTY